MKFFTSFPSTNRGASYQSEKIFVISKSQNLSSVNSSSGLGSWKDLVKDLLHSVPDMPILYSKDLGIKNGDNLIDFINNQTNNYFVLFVEPGQYVLSGYPTKWCKILTADYLLGTYKDLSWTAITSYFDFQEMQLRYGLAPGVYTKFIIMNYSSSPLVSLFGGCIDLNESQWEGYLEATGSSVLAFGWNVNNESNLFLSKGTLFYHKYSNISTAISLEDCRLVSDFEANYMKFSDIWGNKLDVHFLGGTQSLEAFEITLNNLHLPFLSNLSVEIINIMDTFVISDSDYVEIEINGSMAISRLVITHGDLELTFNGINGYIGELIFTRPSDLVINIPAQTSSITIGKIIGASSYTKNGDGQVTILS